MVPGEVKERSPYTFTGRQIDIRTVQELPGHTDVSTAFRL
jgi:hypothetical protein